MSRNLYRAVRSVVVPSVLLLTSACGLLPADLFPFLDNSPPKTRAEPPGQEFMSPLTISLDCDDGKGTGCAATHYTVDGSEPSTDSPIFVEPILISRSTTLRFFSVDKEGNREPVRTEVYALLDDQPPTTTPSPPAGSYACRVTVSLNCSDGEGSGCAATYYSFNGEPTTLYTRPIEINVIGGVSLNFSSVDLAGNTEPVRSAIYSIRYVPDFCF